VVINTALLDHFLPKSLNFDSIDTSHDTRAKYTIDCGDIFSRTFCVDMAICDLQNSEG
jgi:hypothetical protein